METDRLIMALCLPGNSRPPWKCLKTLKALKGFIRPLKKPYKAPKGLIRSFRGLIRALIKGLKGRYKACQGHSRACWEALDGSRLLLGRPQGLLVGTGAA